MAESGPSNESARAIARPDGPRVNAIQHSDLSMDQRVNCVECVTFRCAQAARCGDWAAYSPQLMWRLFADCGEGAL
jgi:hypothetical protein